MKCPYVMRKCSKCGEILHMSKFRKNKTGKFGIRKDCKQCENKRNAKYRESHREETKEYNKQYHKTHKEEELEYKRNRYNNDENYRNKYKDKSKIYHQLHKDDEDYINKRKEYRKNNPHIFFNASNRRRNKLESQGRGITKEQWFEMMEFFNWQCAYSGVQLTKENRSIDHVVALDNNGENEPWNCVPMYLNYNSSKKDNYVLEWYLQQDYFDIERLTKIYEWRIYAYEKWGKEMV